jgi:hypothetical protein
MYAMVVYPSRISSLPTIPAAMQAARIAITAMIAIVSMMMLRFCFGFSSFSSLIKEPPGDGRLVVVVLCVVVVVIRPRR